MNPLLNALMRRLHAPMDGEGNDLGGDTATVDRGDEYIPQDDEPDTKVADKKPEAKPATKEAEATDEDDIDPEDPDAETDEAKAEDKPKKKDQRIPLSRHKDLLEKERAKRAELEQKLQQYQRGNDVAELNENITKAEEKIIGLEKEYAKFLADGEVEKAATLMSQIRTLERQMSEAKSDMKIAAAEARATERARYNIALERIEQAYPQLNPDSDDYDEELMQDIVDLKVSYENRRGLTPTAAMQKAVEKLLGTSSKAQAKAIDTTPRVTEKDVAQEVREERKKDAVKKTVAAVGKQPPDASKVGLDSDKAGGSMTAKDVLKLSQDDFGKLSDDMLARMRGDDL
jgi:hypothetical protein